MRCHYAADNSTTSTAEVPNLRTQIPGKFQLPKFQRADRRFLDFEALGFPWSMVIGFWDFTVSTNEPRWEINNIIKATF
jgi:hypothetical protein